jgi:hypothetical protein
MDFEKKGVNRVDLVSLDEDSDSYALQYSVAPFNYGLLPNHVKLTTLLAESRSAGASLW